MLNIATDEEARPVKGELWRLSEEMLQGIDEYEGIDKGHYSREEVDVIVTGKERSSKAYCYFYAVKAGASEVDASLLRAKRISEYPAEEQRRNTNQSITFK